MGFSHVMIEDAKLNKCSSLIIGFLGIIECSGWNGLERKGMMLYQIDRFQVK